jgi:hypothetical protein
MHAYVLGHFHKGTDCVASVHYPTIPAGCVVNTPSSGHKNRSRDADMSRSKELATEHARARACVCVCVCVYVCVL